MNMNDYQVKASKFAEYEDLLYPIISLGIEAAELADEFAKPLLRGDDGDINLDDVLSEAGDVLWNLANILEDWGLTLSEAAEKNISKLQDRQDRGVIRGSGGNR